MPSFPASSWRYPTGRFGTIWY